MVLNNHSEWCWVIKVSSRWNNDSVLIVLAVSSSEKFLSHRINYNWRSNGGLSVEVIFRSVTTERLGEVRCVIWVPVRIGCQFDRLNIALTSNFISVVLWVNVFISQSKKNRIWQTVLYSIYRRDVISHILSGMVE